MTQSCVRLTTATRRPAFRRPRLTPVYAENVRTRRGPGSGSRTDGAAVESPRPQRDHTIRQPASRSRQTTGDRARPASSRPHIENQLVSTDVAHLFAASSSSTLGHLYSTVPFRRSVAAPPRPLSSIMPSEAHADGVKPSSPATRTMINACRLAIPRCPRLVR